MKKLLALLLTLVLALSLAACGGGGNGGKMEEEKDDATYDETFTLLVGDTEEWTPFNNGDVSFENEKDTVIGLTFDGGTVTFEGLTVGKSVVTARRGDEEKTALVTVKENLLEQPDADKPEVPDSFTLNMDADYIIDYGEIKVVKLGGQIITGDSEMYFCFERQDNDEWITAATYGDGSFWDRNDAESNVMSEEAFMTEYALGTSDNENAELRTAGSFYRHFNRTELNYQFEGVKYEEVDGVPCSVFKTKSPSPYYYWVDMETGLTLKYGSSLDCETNYTYRAITEWPAEFMELGAAFPIEDIQS